MTTPLRINILHVLLVAPLMIYVGTQAGRANPQVFSLMLLLGIVALFYHAYMAFQRNARGEGYDTSAACRECVIANCPIRRYSRSIRLAGGPHYALNAAEKSKRRRCARHACCGRYGNCGGPGAVCTDDHMESLVAQDETTSREALRG